MIPGHSLGILTFRLARLPGGDLGTGAEIYPFAIFCEHALQILSLDFHLPADRKHHRLLPESRLVESDDLSVKVDLAARRCIEHCLRRPVPRIAAARFLTALAAKPDWTCSEIAQVRDLVSWGLGFDEESLQT